MAITNYSELKTAIADFLNRDDLTAVIPTFVSLAEANIARDMRHYLQEKRLTASIDERYEILPDDFLEMRRIYLSDGTNLRLMGGDEMSASRLEINDAGGKPRYFYITAEQIEFFPTPDEAYDLTILYYARLPALNLDADFTWLLRDYPDVYLYAALIHSAVYLQDDERIQVWSALYQKAMDDLNRTSGKAQTSGNALVMRVK